MEQKEEWMIVLASRIIRGTGPVELIQAVAQAAGVVMGRAKIGDMVMMLDGRWTKAEGDFSDYRPIIPAPELEPEQPCPNCQNAKDFHSVYSTEWDEHLQMWRCNFCDRPESEWTYVQVEEKPCFNCQGIKKGQTVFCHWSSPSGADGHQVKICDNCGRHLSEWTYAKPEPCPNCQDVKPGRIIRGNYDDIKNLSYCIKCRRPSYEWTYTTSPDPGGI